MKIKNEKFTPDFGMMSQEQFEEWYDRQKNEKPKMGGLKKIADLPKGQRCIHPNHNPPMHIYLTDGIYEYTCPSCGHVQRFTVNHLIF